MQVHVFINRIRLKSSSCIYNSDHEITTYETSNLITRSIIWRLSARLNYFAYSLMWLLEF